MHAVAGLIAWLVATPAWANGPWQMVAETPAEVIAIDPSSFQRSAERVSFRERRTLRDGQIDASSLRPLREVVVKRMVDCRRYRIATLSRAVFSDGDALIDHQAVLPQYAEWQSIAKDDPVFRLVCSRS
jgi:hypothetical protein